MHQSQRINVRSQRSVLAWILYDIASSGYVLLIPGVAFALYYRQAVCGGTAQCDAQWALLTSLALVIAGMVSPLLGAIADLSNLRHRLFVMTTLLCCGATALLYWVHPGDIWFGGVVFVMAQVGYILSAGLYDAFLPGLVPPAQVERISSVGWGLGFIGGLVCFFLAYGWLAAGLEPDNLATYRLTFLLVAGFYLTIALPALAWLPQPDHAPPVASVYRLIRRGYRPVLTTLLNWRDLPETFQFLVGYYLISDVVVTFTSFFTIHLSTVFGLSVAQILRIVLLFNLIAIPATVSVGLLSERLTGKTLLKGVIAIWVGLLLLLTFGTQAWVPGAAVVLLGLVVGSTQSICRGLYARLVPKEQAGELFGFHTLVSRLSAILGPMTYGLISATTDNQRLAMFALVLFLLTGGWIVLKVPMPAKN
jgi:UMF1 family MFS transporter